MSWDRWIQNAIAREDLCRKALVQGVESPYNTDNTTAQRGEP